MQPWPCLQPIWNSKAICPVIWTTFQHKHQLQLNHLPLPLPPTGTTSPLYTTPSSSTCQLHNISTLQMMKAIVLSVGSWFSFDFKPTNTLQQSSDFPQIGATPFSPIYSFIFYFTLPGFPCITIYFTNTNIFYCSSFLYSILLFHPCDWNFSQAWKKIILYYFYYNFFNRIYGIEMW